MTSLQAFFNSPGFSKPFEFIIALAIITSVIAFAVGTLPSPDETTLWILNLSEHVFVSVFTLEYLIRLIRAEKKTQYIFSFYGVIDLLAILPYYLVMLFGLQPLRLLSLFRLVRILKLTRYLTAMRRFYLALADAWEELTLFFAASMVMIFLAAVGIYHFEHEAQPEVYRSLFDALWWAIVTLTTVGYGDMVPITHAGRLFTFGVLLTGLGLIAVPTAIIAASLHTVRERLADETKNDDYNV